MTYISDRGRRELSLPVSILRRCFMRMVIGSNWDGEGPAPEFQSVATKNDVAIYDALLKAELEPFSGLSERDTRRLHNRVLSDRDVVMRPYERGSLLAAFMTGIGIVVRLQEQGVLSMIDARSDLSKALDTLVETVRGLCPTEWRTYERGTYNQAGHIITAMTRMGYRYQAELVTEAAE